MSINSLSHLGPTSFAMNQTKRSSQKDLSDLFVKNIFGFAGHKEESPVMTEGAMSTLDINMDVTDIITGLSSSFSPTLASSPLLSSDALIADAALFQGGFTTLEAKEKYHLMEHARAHSRKTDAIVDMVRGAIQASSGAVNIGYRPLVVACFAKGIDPSTYSSTSLLGRATYLLGAFGATLSSLFFSCTAFIFGRAHLRSCSFEAKLLKHANLKDFHSAENVKKLSSFLIEQRYNSTPLSTMTKIIEKHAVYGAKKIFSRTAKSSTESWIKALLKEGKKEGIDTSHLASAKEITSKMFDHIGKDPKVKGKLLDDLGLKGHPTAKLLSVEELVGLELESRAHALKKQVKLTDLIGHRGAELVKEGANSDLLARLSSDDEAVRAKALEEGSFLCIAVCDGLKTKKKISLAQFISSTIGIVGAIGACLPVSGAIGAALTFTGIASFIGLFITDLYNFKHSHSDGGPSGKYDKLLVKISCVIGILSVAASVVTASVLSFGALPSILVIFTISLWLANNIYGYYKVCKKDKEHRLLHPSLHDMRESLEKAAHSERLDHNLLTMFKNLSRDDKKAIKQKMLKTHTKDRRILIENDKLLDRDHRFGMNYFLLNPRDEVCKRAIEKSWQMTRSDRIRGLLDRLDTLAKKEIVDYFHQKLSSEEKGLIFERIYYKKAKKLSSRLFAQAPSSKIKGAIDELILEREKKIRSDQKNQIALQLEALGQIAKA